MVPGIRPFLTEGGLYFNLKYVNILQRGPKLCDKACTTIYIIIIDVQPKTDDIVKYVKSLD